MSPVIMESERKKGRSLYGDDPECALKKLAKISKAELLCKV